MKRAGNLIEQIADYKNIYHAYWKASRGKYWKQEVIEYGKDIAENLLTIQKEINDGIVDVGNYHYFKIYDPKERKICAASFKERVLHHALMNVCDEFFDKFQIFHSYATRKNKGTHKAIENAGKYTKSNMFFLKMDVRKYFDSIDQEVLLELLKVKFKEEKLLKIFEQIIKSYSTNKDKGVPIGNLTSQYFANFYLAFLDHYLKEELQIKYYIRYMDDMVVWSNSKDELKRVSALIKNFLINKLRLELKPLVLNRTSLGVSFLGYKIFPNFMKLNNRSKRRFISKVNSYWSKIEDKQWTQEDYQRHMLPLLDFTMKANTYGLRNSIFNREMVEGL